MGTRGYTEEGDRSGRLGETVADWRDYRDHGDWEIYRGRREGRVGDWGRQWMTGETTETMGGVQGICRGRREKSGRGY